MSAFWPERPSPEGFSIDRTFKKAKDRIGLKVSGHHANSLNRIRKSSFNELEGSLKAHSKVVSSSTSDKPLNHWANREFDEYRNAA